MSAITSDWAPIETGMPVTPPVESGKAYGREEEFRSALDRYIAGWVAEQQKRRTAETSARNSYFTVARRFAGWVRIVLSQSLCRGSPIFESLANVVDDRFGR